MQAQLLETEFFNVYSYYKHNDNLEKCTEKLLLIKPPQPDTVLF